MKKIRIALGEDTVNLRLVGKWFVERQGKEHGLSSQVSVTLLLRLIGTFLQEINIPCQQGPSTYLCLYHATE